MTAIRIHGVLGREFRSHLSLSINKPKEIIDAIDSNCKNFKNRLLQLSREGIHYAIIVDGVNIKHIEEITIKKSPKSVDLIPLICGQGAVALGVVAVASFAAGAAGVGAAIGITAAAWVSLGVMALSMAVQMALAPNPKSQQTKSSISGADKSYLLNSKGNVAEQGTPVPVGYGRLRAGSKIIQTTIKSFPQKQTVTNALIGDNNANQVSVAVKTK